jgi:hypothetical protein
MIVAIVAIAIMVGRQFAYAIGVILILVAIAGILDLLSNRR